MRKEWRYCNHEVLRFLYSLRVYIYIYIFNRLSIAWSIYPLHSFTVQVFNLRSRENESHGKMPLWPFNPAELFRSKSLRWWFNIHFDPSHPRLDIYVFMWPWFVATLPGTTGPARSGSQAAWGNEDNGLRSGCRCGCSLPWTNPGSMMANGFQESFQSIIGSKSPTYRAWIPRYLRCLCPQNHSHRLFPSVADCNPHHLVSLLSLPLTPLRGHQWL